MHDFFVKNKEIVEKFYKKNNFLYSDLLASLLVFEDFYVSSTVFFSVLTFISIKPKGLLTYRFKCSHLHRGFCGPFACIAQSMLAASQRESVQTRRNAGDHRLPLAATTPSRW